MCKRFLFITVVINMYSIVHPSYMVVDLCRIHLGFSPFVGLRIRYYTIQLDETIKSGINKRIVQ